jgi:hypothetical protein
VLKFTSAINQLSSFWFIDVITIVNTEYANLLKAIEIARNNIRERHIDCVFLGQWLKAGFCRIC